MTRPPRLVIAATAAFGLLTAFWSVLTPLTEAPDEPAHLGLIHHVAETWRYPAYDGLQHSEGIFDLCVQYAVSVKWCRTNEESAAHRQRRERPADAAPSKHDRMHWDDPAFAAPKPGRLNQMPQHPPLYYFTMAGGLRAERALVPGELSIDTELAFLRLLNVLVVVPLPWLAWLLARRLGAGDEVGTVAALLPLAVPQLTHIGSTLNNDNMFMVVVTALMVLLAGVVRGDRSRRTALLVGLATGLALLTKGFGVVLPPIVVLAYVLETPTDAGVVRRGRRAAPPAALALGTGVLLSGWWYLGNLVRTGHVMPSIESSRLSPANRPPGFQFHFGRYLDSTWSRVVNGFWGDFGWRRVELPWILSVAVTAACVLAVYRILRRPPRLADGDGSPVARSWLALLLAPITLLATFVIVRSALIYRDAGELRFQQGRYLFAGLVAAGVVVALAAHRRFGPRAVPATLAAVAGLQGVAVLVCLRGWWGADGVPMGSVGSIVAWSGWPDPVALALLATAPTALALLFMAARAAQAAQPSRSGYWISRMPRRRPGKRLSSTQNQVRRADAFAER